MIVNMYVDHLMPHSPQSAEEVWMATREHPKLFSDAANRIGLTPAEYREFRTRLLDGQAVYLQLPRRVDAMSGARRGTAYAVKNAVMLQPIMGWRVALADGNVVYVPQICGNISLLRHAAVAEAVVPKHRKHPAYVAHTYYHAPTYTPAVAEQPVDMTPPVPVEQEAPVETPPTVAQAIPAASSSHPIGGFFLIPAAIAGAIAGFSHTSPPPCAAGSNADFACKK
jgi:hypothetical protein